MANAIFISENWIKTNTPLPYNIDVKKLYPFYNLSQEKYIRDVLGDELYNILSANLVANTLTPLQITLMELIRPCLAYYIIYEALPFIATEIKNIGVVNTADDKQTSATNQIVKELKQNVQDNAEYFMKRITSYLCTNHKLYPEYNFNNTDVNPNVKAGYSCDLYIDPDFIDEKFVKRYYRY